MKKTKKLLALLLCVVMCLSLFPVSALAAEEEPAEDVVALEIGAEETEAEEAGEPVEPAEPEEPGSEVGETEQDPPETAEEPDPEIELTDAEEPAQDEDAEEGAEPAELPCGFAGMPEGYAFSEEELAAKRVLTEMGIVDALAGGSYVEGELLVNTSSEEYAELVAQAYCAEMVSFEGFFAIIRLTGATVREAVEAAADMELPLPAVEPNWIFTQEPVSAELAEPDIEEQALTTRYWQDWYNAIESSNADPFLRYPSYDNYQWQHDTVHTYTAWSVTTGSSGVTVAVIDSGVNYNNTDLSGKVIKGWDYVGGDDDPQDENGHGTHVAGILAAKMGNATAGAGIAPNVRILAVRAGDANSKYSASNIASAIRYAAENGAQIINMSFGGPVYNTSIKSAIDYAYTYGSYGTGATLIAAMGNEGSNIKQYPAAYDHVIAVGATNRDGSRAAFSNYGAWCDVSAPGVGIYSTVGTGTGVMSGTSQATPIVSGVAALYMSVYGNPGPKTMEKILKAAVNKGGGSGMGKGIIDAVKVFKGKKNPPHWGLYSSLSVNTDGGRVPQDGYIRLESGSGITESTACFLYTTDGTDPQVLDGQAVNGQNVSELGWYDEEQGCYILPMASFAVGETVHFKFMEVEAGAIAGEIAETEVVITEAAPEIANVRVGISGAGKLRLGQSTVLTAQVYGESAAEGVEVQQVAMPDQTVVWSVVEPAGDDRVSVDENGTVKVSRVFDGDRIVVRAESTVYFGEDGAPVFADYVLDISTLLRVGSISLAGEVPTLYTGEIWNPELVITDEEGTPMSLEEAGLVWTSSNEKVAKVMQVRNEETGVYEVAVYAAQEGNVKLTGTASDGSGEEVTIMAAVRPSVNSITVSGQSVIKPGSAVAFKAAILPKNAGNKKLTWYISGTIPSGVSIDSATGKVTVASYASVGSTFTVRARTAVAPTVYSNSFSVTVDNKATGVQLSRTGTIQIYSVDLPDKSGYDNRVSISASRLGVNYGSKGIVWSGGNASIASFTDNGSGTLTVTAKKAGKVTFTAKAMDGSGKSAKITVKVITPASAVTIVSKTKNESMYIGYGKSAKNKAVLGSSYGKPSISKVSWDYNIYTTSGSSYVLNSSMTSTMKTLKLITINGSGTLTIKAGAESWVSGYYIGVTAKTTDGTNFSDTVYYYPIALTNSIKLYDEGYVGYSSHEWSKKYIWLVKKGYYYTIDIDGRTKSGARSLSDYTVKSSNPNKVGAYYEYDSNTNREKLYLFVDSTAKTGNVTVKVTACDGSNKSYTLKLRVIN